MSYELATKLVLVTGGTGFLGRTLCRELHYVGALPVAVGRARGDLRDLDDVRQLLDETRPHVVIHAAANVGGIGYNRAHPRALLHDNLLMGLNLLRECALPTRRGHHIERFVLIGTACAYPGEAPVPTPETELWNGYPEPTNAPYGLAKRLLMEAARVYRTESLKTIAIIPTNLYGPGDTFDPERSHVVPAVIRKIGEAVASGQSDVVFFGDGTPTRDLLYVDDAARGILELIEADEPGPTNLGTGTEVSIRQLVHLIAAQMGYRGHVLWNTELPGGQRRRALDASRALSLGWKPEVPLEGGLVRTIDYYRSCVAR